MVFDSFYSVMNDWFWFNSKDFVSATCANSLLLWCLPSLFSCPLTDLPLRHERKQKWDRFSVYLITGGVYCTVGVATSLLLWCRQKFFERLFGWHRCLCVAVNKNNKSPANDLEYCVKRTLDQILLRRFACGYNTCATTVKKILASTNAVMCHCGYCVSHCKTINQNRFKRTVWKFESSLWNKRRSNIHENKTLLKSQHKFLHIKYPAICAELNQEQQTRPNLISELETDLSLLYGYNQ